MSARPHRNYAADPDSRRRGAVGATLAAALGLVAGATCLVLPTAATAASARVTLPSVIAPWTNGAYVHDQGPLAADWKLNLRIYISADAAGRTRLATQVSDPHGPQYRHYLTAGEASARFNAGADARAAVTTWLTSAGFNVNSSTTHYLSVTAQAAAVTHVFGTKLDEFTSDFGETGYAAVSDATVPAEFAGTVETVMGLDEAPWEGPISSGAAGPPPARSGTTVPCSHYWGEHLTSIPQANGVTTSPTEICGYTPQQMRTAYGVTGSPYTGKGATIAIVLDGHLPTMAGDAQRFFAAQGVAGFAPGQYREDVPPSVDATCQGFADMPEEALDVETAHIAAPAADVVYVAADCSQSTSGRQLGLLDAETRVVDQHLADVTSESFSINESEFSPAQMAAWTMIFQLGAVEGIGFNFDSGDGGDQGDGGVAYPASDPWATGVGGTSLRLDAAGAVSGELGWGDDAAQISTDGTSYLTDPPGIFTRGSTGGRSAVFAQPAYQAGVVPASVTAGFGVAAPGMRAVPDLAANADGRTGWLIGYTDPGTGIYRTFSEGGTSGSAPLVAGLLADAKQASGGLAVGFANPALYARNGTLALHDVLPDPAGTVTTAVYNEADTDPVVTDLATLGRDSSLTVTPGFDNVTGLGSPTTRFVASFATAPPVKTPPVMTPPKRVPPPVAAAPPAARSGGTTKEPAANTVTYVDVVIDSGGPTPPGHRMSAPVTGGVSCLVIACGIALAALRRRRRPTP